MSVAVKPLYADNSMIDALKQLGMFLAVLGLMTGAASRSEAGEISTIPNATSTINSFGQPSSGSTPTYGQTFVASSSLGLFLDSVTFVVANPQTSAVPFQAFVYGWNGTGITGPALYASSTQQISPNGNSFTPITVDLGGTLLNNGSQYIVFYSTLNNPGSVGGLSFQVAPDSSYAQGTFRFNNSTTSISDLNGGWGPVGDVVDLGFTLSFSSDPTVNAVPEPSTLAGAGLGIAVAVGAALKRRRKAAVA